jgi:hypothetical protein
MKAKDARIKATNEALSGIRLIKYNGWEEPTLENIAALRATELAALRSYLFVQAGAGICVTRSPHDA